MGKRKYPLPTVGQQFGDWTVVDDRLQYYSNGQQKGKGVLVRCKCGTEKVQMPNTLYRKQSLRCDVCRNEAISKTKFEGVGQLSRAYYGQVRLNAKQRGIEFNVSIEYLWNLFQEQNGQCALTNMPLTLARSYANKIRKKVIDDTASLDRINSNLCYVEGNVQWVHKTVNMMKNNLKQDEFVAFCKAVATHNHNKPLVKVITRLNVEGIHRWKKCPIEEVSYLRNYHRHTFFIIAECFVSHNDRDIEFIELSHKIKDYLHKKYFSKQYQCLFFDDNSCEMVANELVTVFDLASCEVNEDGEGGAIVKSI